MLQRELKGSISQAWPCEAAAPAILAVSFVNFESLFDSGLHRAGLVTDWAAGRHHGPPLRSWKMCMRAPSKHPAHRSSSHHKNVRKYIYSIFENL